MGYIFALQNERNMANVKEKQKKLIDVSPAAIKKAKKVAFDKDTSVKKVIEMWVEAAANKD